MKGTKLEIKEMRLRLRGVSRAEGRQVADRLVERLSKLRIGGNQSRVIGDLLLRIETRNSQRTLDVQIAEAIRRRLD